MHAVADPTADPALAGLPTDGRSWPVSAGSSAGPFDGPLRALLEARGGLLGDEFRDRVLPFDERCASRYADIVCGREALGRPIGAADAQIAAICRTAEATLATRNTDDFSGTGIELINPWKLDRPEPALRGDRIRTRAVVRPGRADT